MTDRCLPDRCHSWVERQLSLSSHSCARSAGGLLLAGSEVPPLLFLRVWNVLDDLADGALKVLAQAVQIIGASVVARLIGDL